jgi:hypothetical protein
MMHRLIDFGFAWFLASNEKKRPRRAKKGREGNSGFPKEEPE